VLAPAFAIDKMPATEQTCSDHSLSVETYTYLCRRNSLKLFSRGSLCTWASVLELEVFVSELLAINRLASSTVSASEVTTLR
jgi:hypothetical protein